MVDCHLESRWIETQLRVHWYQADVVATDPARGRNLEPSQVRLRRGVDHRLGGGARQTYVAGIRYDARQCEVDRSGVRLGSSGGE